MEFVQEDDVFGVEFRLVKDAAEAVPKPVVDECIRRERQLCAEALDSPAQIDVFDRRQVLVESAGLIEKFFANSHVG